MSKARVAKWDLLQPGAILAAFPAAIFLIALAALFVYQSLPAWKAPIFETFPGITWFYRQSSFGLLPMIYGTLVVSFLAIGVAILPGLGAAVFLSELAPPAWRWPLKALVELLAGVPSVVYGLLGVLYLRNWVYDGLAPWDPLSGDSLLTAGILLAVMILPTVITLADDAMRGVALAPRLAARGLGLTRAEGLISVVLPMAAPGIFSAVLLALGRALGETIAVFLVVGRQDNVWPEHLWDLQPLISAGQTLTSKLGGSEVNIAQGDPIHWGALMILGLVLLLMTLAVTSFGVQLAHRNHHA
jgi:phosphate transport system permease protein